MSSDHPVINIKIDNQINMYLTIDDFLGIPNWDDDYYQKEEIKRIINKSSTMYEFLIKLIFFINELKD